ncbi:MAG: trypsin-like serine peptidase, partial [Actinomycetota bacterium]
MSDRTPFRRTIMLAVAFMLAALFPSIASNASPATPDTKPDKDLPPVVRGLNPDKKAIKAALTRKAMRSVESLDMSVEFDDVSSSISVTDPDASGVAVSVPAVGPSETSLERNNLRNAATARTKVPRIDVPFTRTEIVNTTVYPHVTHGKLFMLEGGVPIAVCSATVVNSVSKNVVWTAGHCVEEGAQGGFYQDFAFIPGYPSEPHGVWFPERVVTTPEWAQDGDFSFDVAALTMEPKA